LSKEILLPWLILIGILLAVISRRIHFEVAAFSGLLVLGLSGVADIADLFSGFASPALFTIAVVLMMSRGITDSGLFNGLGEVIQRKIKNPRMQLLMIFLNTAFLSAFMNNVGAAGILIPTSKRMAKRIGAKQSDFGLALVYAALLGGSATLIGTGSNLIVSSFRGEATGQPFRIFDFLPHGFAIITVGIVFLFICEQCGWILHNPLNQLKERTEGIFLDPLPKSDAKKLFSVLLPLLPAIIMSATGWLPPVLAFGFVILIWGVLKILSAKDALESLNLPVLVIIGSMLSLSKVMQQNGAFVPLTRVITPLIGFVPEFFFLLLLVLITCVLANIMDNVVAAVIMAPMVLQLSSSNAQGIPLDALLMAVAAGASLSILLPTNKVTLVVQAEMGFSSEEFMQKGVAIAIFSVLIAALVIWLIWS
jgi:di/tricarboxylate transporter